MNKYIVASILFPIIDAIYLKIISKHYNNVVKNISGKEIQFNYIKAIFAYIVLIIGINYFIISKMNKENIKKSLIDSFILGFVIYGTFDFTNGAIFEKYDYTTIIIDTLWGSILHTIITYLTHKIIF